MRARNAIVKYLEALDGGDFATALGCFTDDAVYAVPPTPDVGGRSTQLLRGRFQISDHFARRGRRSFRHQLHALGHADRRWWATGTVELGGNDVVLFTSSASVNERGLMTTYFTASTAVTKSEAEELLC